MATILLIEDDVLLADCYVRWLASAGHKIQHVPDAQSAINAADEHRPDLILLDMLLPGANGMQVLHILQSHADLATIPVVVCSNALPDPAPNLSAYGVKNVVNKTTLTRPVLCAAIAGAI